MVIPGRDGHQALPDAFVDALAATFRTFAGALATTPPFSAFLIRAEIRDLMRAARL